MTKTPIRTVRVNDALWRAVSEKAAREGTSVSDIIREALEAYLQS